MRLKGKLGSKLFSVLVFAACCQAIAQAAASDAQEMRGLCATDEQVLFACSTKAHKLISLCGSKELTATTGHVQYRFGTTGKVELEFPGQLDDSRKQFLFSHYFRFQVDRTTVAFVRGGYTYTIFHDYEGDAPPAVTTAGVEVTTPGSVGKTTNVECAGAVVNKLSVLQGIVPCDKNDSSNMAECP